MKWRCGRLKLENWFSYLQVVPGFFLYLHAEFESWNRCLSSQLCRLKDCYLKLLFTICTQHFYNDTGIDGEKNEFKKTIYGFIAITLRMLTYCCPVTPRHKNGH